MRGNTVGNSSRHSKQDASTLSKVSKTNDRMEQKLNLLQKTTSAKLSAQRIIRGMNFPFEIRCFQQFSCEVLLFDSSLLYIIRKTISEKRIRRHR